MNVKLEPGIYTVAVSGGVDSVVLLDLLAHQPGLKLVVAHYDHGIRSDSIEDKEFVEGLAANYGLDFYIESGQLGHRASEALARSKRYQFLEAVKSRTNSLAIVTAHHQDDLIETALINLLRGTGRRGLSSLRSTTSLRRPLLPYTKAEILAYAQNQRLTWREDSTNSSDAYLRNYIRHKLTPRLSQSDRQQLLIRLTQADNANQEIDNLLAAVMNRYTEQGQLDRAWFSGLPHDLAKEVLLAWLKRAGVLDIDRGQIERTVVLLKTLPHGKLVDVNAEYQLEVGKQKLALITRER